MRKVWDGTFSPVGFGIAVTIGTSCGAVRNALTPDPVRTSYDYNGSSQYQMDEKLWLLEGMVYGALGGALVNATWPVFLPASFIFFSASFIQDIQ